MGLSIGIVGLPNVGKSTLFNALTRAQNAAAANYPFCTVEPNHAVVAVPDARLARLADLVEPARIVPATVDFVDIAGLVKGASRGEGLGNQFLGNIRETAATLHVVRCFENEDIAHVAGAIDPLRDIEIIETELVLADLQTLEKAVERLGRRAKGEKDAKAMVEEAEHLRAHLDAGRPASTYAPVAPAAAAQLSAELGLITAKELIYCANVDEQGLEQDNEHVRRVREYAAGHGKSVVKISARVEEELVGLEDAERAEFLASYGVTESGIEQVIRRSYAALGLISYFTAGPKEVRAWTIRQGTRAPQAAAVIHTDFERGFIRAEVISYDDFTNYRSEAKCREAGVLRVEGKDYVVRDGDVMHFRFNV